MDSATGRQPNPQHEPSKTRGHRGSRLRRSLAGSAVPIEGRGRLHRDQLEERRRDRCRDGRVWKRPGGDEERQRTVEREKNGCGEGESERNGRLGLVRGLGSGPDLGFCLLS
ncbi:unnamed protein product [Musa acuminata subsp. burmannicoides]